VNIWFSFALWTSLRRSLSLCPLLLDLGKAYGIEVWCPLSSFWVPLLLCKVYGIRVWCSLPLGQKMVIENFNNKNSIRAMRWWGNTQELLYTTLIYHSLSPILFLKIMKVTTKGNDFYICILRMQSGKFLFQDAKSLRFL
jgi:hypothetical protein